MSIHYHSDASGVMSDELKTGIAMRHRDVRAFKGMQAGELARECFVSNVRLTVPIAAK